MSRLTVCAVALVLALAPAGAAARADAAPARAEPAAEPARAAAAAEPAAAEPAAAEPARAMVIQGGPRTAADPTPVRLDADVYLPADTPAPAVVLAHGFGGSKHDVAEQAAALAQRGFVVLAYTARGFGASGGRITMNAPRFEVADARAVVDAVAALPQVRADAPGDPRVGIAGGSYGGALALLAAGYDERVDAVAADITYNDLTSSLFGQQLLRPATPPTGAPGVFKLWWAGGFFAAGLTDAEPCGRFAPGWCRLYQRAAQGRDLTAGDRRRLDRSSPASVTGRITVPTLLGAGQADSLFPFGQAVATHDQIARAHPDTPVKVVWHGGGHDGGIAETERLLDLTGDWFTAHLAAGPPVADTFDVTLSPPGATSRRQLSEVSLPRFTGLAGQRTGEVTLAGAAQWVRFPAGGAPAAVSTFPGLGALAGAVGGIVPPGQAASFDSDPIPADTTVIGAPRVSLTVSSATVVRAVTLFASLQVVTAAGIARTPQGLVAPVLVDRVDAAGVELVVELPAIATRLAAGDRLRVVVATTDAAYRLPTRPALLRVGLAGPAVTVPVVDTAASAREPVSGWLAAAIPIVLGVALLVWLVRPRVPQPRFVAELAGVPLAVRSLGKVYRGGVRAVDDVTFQVPAGVVLGLLGPNGAGKTTTMRMVMGLIRPSHGDVHVFGHRVHPGARVLSRIGVLVEGSGFLPHLTGRQNLDLFWRATGRGGDPGFDDVLAIAGLGHAVDRPVKSYSHGMRQRLGIAQAMLGRPDVLILDEPTNGLDPPQIRQMRQVLRDYAATGATVIVSSHLLAEVELTCSHVVVMQRGRLVAAGEVVDLLAGRAHLEDVFLEIIGTDRTVGGG